MAKHSPAGTTGQWRGDGNKRSVPPTPATVHRTAGKDMSIPLPKAHAKHVGIYISALGLPQAPCWMKEERLRFTLIVPLNYPLALSLPYTHIFGLILLP